jgi:hypothetical protein
MHRLLRHISWIGMAVVVTLCVSGCATFHLTQGSFQPKGKKLAVIAGLTNPSSLQAAQALADEVGKASQFQVMPPPHIAQAIPNYPQLIKGPYTSAYFEIDEDYDKTDVGRVKEIQKHLGTDYLYVLWAPTSVQSGGKGLFFKNYPVMHVVAQVFEFPGGREIGHGKYMIRVDDDHKELLRDDLARVAKEFAEKTHMPK